MVDEVARLLAAFDEAVRTDCAMPRGSWQPELFFAIVERHVDIPRPAAELTAKHAAFVEAVARCLFVTHRASVLRTPWDRF